jgi:protein-tyrosine phosphatase
MVDYQFVTERLAIGGSIGTATNMRELARAGITHVVNMQKEFDDSLLTDGSGVEVLWNGCEDDFLPKPADLFWKGVRFTLAALADPGAKVYFHCAAGVHRSPIMLLAVLRVLGYERRQAINMISDARPLVNFPLVYLMSVEDFYCEYRASMRAD